MAKRGLDIDSGRWWTHSWSIVEGCSPKSEGCRNCWLSTMQRFKSTPGCPKHSFDGTIQLHSERLYDPLARSKSQRVYMVLSDLFHELVPVKFIHDAFTVMAASKHIFVVLTKRPERIRETLYGEAPFFDMWSEKTFLKNVYLGTSIENQDVLEKRLRPLLAVPGHKIVSFEPLLGEIIIPGTFLAAMDCSIDGVIVGGETGPRARPMKPEWAYSLLEQFSSIRVPYFFKSWGGKEKSRKLHYRVWNALPWRIDPETSEGGLGFKWRKEGAGA